MNNESKRGRTIYCFPIQDKVNGEILLQGSSYLPGMLFLRDGVPVYLCIVKRETGS